MSIALKHIKERRFINNGERESDLPSGEHNILDPPLSNPQKTLKSEKRPSQTAKTTPLGDEPGQGASNNENTTMEKEIKGEDVQTAKSLDSETLIYWEIVFNDAPTLKECEIMDILLKLAKLEWNPSNNTKMINKIFKDSYNGYIKQTSSNSHIWELANKKSIKDTNYLAKY